MSGALIGFAGAVGALGGVFINVALRLSYTGAAKSATNAFWVFLVFYVVCAVVTWFVFLRMQSVRTVAGEHVGLAHDGGEVGQQIAGGHGTGGHGVGS